MPEIGATLREARMRARIDVSEIEAQTKIRAKYLRALENEEWGLLPGPTFVKSFLRTYAQALGLDGKALVEEYRLQNERGSEAFEPIVSSPRSARSPRRKPRSGPSRGYTIAVGAILAVIVLLIVLLVVGGGGGSSNKSSTTTPTSAKAVKHHPSATHHSSPRRGSAGLAFVSLSLTATGPVYVCLIGDDGRKLVPGTELQSGESTPTFHARRFLVTLGNNALTMYIDGRPHTVPASSQAIGYSITKANGRRVLAAGELPTCK
jgi:cytoskeletal protein RodZ